MGNSRSRAAQGRLECILFYYFHGRNATRTCRCFGINRQTFYRWKPRFDRHDLSTLEERSHRPRSVGQPTWADLEAGFIETALSFVWRLAVADIWVPLLCTERRLHVTESRRPAQGSCPRFSQSEPVPSLALPAL